ncbi:MAG: RNA polymerase sigma factor RpoD/SigA [Marinifilaceae bacterium]
MRQLKITKQITNRESHSIDQYLQEIGKVEMLNAEEEVELAKRIKSGDELALRTLVKANLRFVVSVAKQYQNQGLSLSDLINEGNLGLMKAAKCFDETRGFKFISYAVWWIRQSILQSLAENSRLIRLPLNKISSINKINKAYAKLEQEHEREPTPAEIGGTLEMTPKEVQDNIKVSGRHLSMDAPLKSEEDNNMHDIFSSHNVSDEPDINLQKESLTQEIEIAISSLSKREAQILRMYYGINGCEGSSLEEIGHNLELTSERVRQIKTKAIKKLKSSPKCSRLKVFL